MPVKKIIVLPGKSDAGKRLDVVLAGNLTAFSRRECRQLITLGGVFIDGHRASRVSRPMRVGEEIAVHLDGEGFKPKFHIIPETILYEDDYLLALNKPSGVESQPTPARYRGTVYAAVRDYLRSGGRYPTVGLHSRLDKQVSGVMILSTDRRAHGGMTDLFREKRVEKLYCAIVQGVPKRPAGEVSTMIVRRGGKSCVAREEGKEALTRYRVLEHGKCHSLVLFKPRTGRTHQIRLHASHLGCPILGDTLYGAVDEEVPRLFLHAVRIKLVHPVTHRHISITAPASELFDFWHNL